MNSMEILKAFLNRIDTQDNLGTSKPIQFLLQTPEDIITDGNYRYDRVEYYHPVMENHGEKTKEDAHKYFVDYGFEGEELEEHMDELQKVYFKTVWRTEQAFLTRDGVDRHLDMNRHNYRNGHQVYAVHAFRDPEIKELYDAIRDVVTQAQGYQEIAVPKEG